MNVQFGFLAYPDVFSADVPSHIDGVPELATTIMIQGGPRQAVYSPASRVDTSGPLYRYSVDDGGVTVSVYEYVDAPPIIAPYWQIAGGYLRTHLATDYEGSAGLQTLIDGLTVYVDQFGFVRVSLSAPLSLADLREEQYRDEVEFISTTETGVPLAVRLAWAGPFGHDDGKVWENTCAYTRTTPLGVTVMCEGLAVDRKDVEAMAGQIASTTRRL